MKSKKKFIIIIIGVALVLGLTLLYFKSHNSYEDTKDMLSRATEESKKIKNSEMKEFNNITVLDYLDFLQNGDKVLVFVGRNGCQYCQIAEPIVKNIMFKNNLDIYYLSTDDFTVETEDLFMTSDDRLNSFATPLLLSLKDGVITDGVQGLRDKENYNSFLKDNGFIK